MSSPWFNSDQNADPYCGLSPAEFRERQGDKIHAQAAEIARLRAALEWFADEESKAYKPITIVNGFGRWMPGGHPALFARAALSGEGRAKG